MNPTIDYVRMVCEGLVARGFFKSMAGELTIAVKHQLRSTHAFVFGQMDGRAQTPQTIDQFVSNAEEASLPVHRALSAGRRMVTMLLVPVIVSEQPYSPAAIAYVQDYRGPRFGDSQSVWLAPALVQTKPLSIWHTMHIPTVYRQSELEADLQPAAPR